MILPDMISKSKKLPPHYNPAAAQDRIYRIWEQSGFFNPDKLRGAKEPYCITVPPPNVTGSLHMGHALNAVIQDIVIRKKRMEGYKTLWLPGTDHAGIATQNVVEKELKKEGLTRHDIGREKLIERIWQWKEKYGTTILDQFKKLGSSMDWSRTRFTMDPEYQEAVMQAFLRYYKKGWIYRGERTVNWCTRCATSLSDLEVEYREEDAEWYEIKYGPLVIGTVRPETKLGDTAIAVNPKDSRYKDFIGRDVEIDTVLGPAKVKVISDPEVDRDFGTGVMKVTPAHDMHDFELAEKHGLEKKQVIGPDGRMTERAGKYAGMTVKEARARIVEDLEAKGLLVSRRPYRHNVAVCYRCGTVIEPLLSKQWFLKMSALSRLAVEAVKSGKIRFHPKRWERPYLDWQNNIRDWCISRQIWWGHQIPVWFCGKKPDVEPEIQSRIKTEAQSKMSEPPKYKRMGFAGDVVPQVFADKTRTYRLRDHGLKKGDWIAFENSASGEIFGYAAITGVVKTDIGSIELKDLRRHTTYRTHGELIRAFKRHPQKIDIRSLNEKTPVWIYAYEFLPGGRQASSGQFIVSRTRPPRCPSCGSCEMERSSDVLDTWFSSALWPFATLGWPAYTKDLATFYPTQFLSTARDIINLWVARMVFSGTECMGKAPFRDVVVHATILAKDGRRMSKSLGTGVDPMDLIGTYGADATRFGIIWQAMGNQDIRWSGEHVVAGKKFCNKIWNSARFVLGQFGDSRERRGAGRLSSGSAILPKARTAEDRKILSSLEKTKKEVNRRLERYEFGPSLRVLYDFYWHQFCDRYLEKSKMQMKDRARAASTRKILVFVLAESLKMLHPFLPFITEEVWSRLPFPKRRLLIVEPWG
jgi:valyl-tRNA synthetase